MKFDKDFVGIKDKHGGVTLSANKLLDLFLFENLLLKLFFARKSSDEAMK